MRYFMVVLFRHWSVWKLSIYSFYSLVYTSLWISEDVYVLALVLEKHHDCLQEIKKEIYIGKIAFTPLQEGNSFLV